MKIFNYFRQGGYVLPVFVYLFVCLSVIKITQKSYGRIFLKF